MPPCRFVSHTLSLMSTLLPMLLRGDEFAMNFEAVSVAFSAFFVLGDFLRVGSKTSQRRGLLRQWGPKKPHQAGPTGLAYGGAIRLARGIISSLCTMGNESALYMRIPLSTGWGLCRSASRG